MANEVYMSEEGYKKLQDDLDELKSVKRHEIAERIRIAREFGDLSENAEYDAAKDEQAKNESTILQMEEQLKNAVIIAEKVKSTKEVAIYSTVVVKDEDGEEDTYKIVGETETDIDNNLISNSSPVGAALLKHKKGETVEVKIPNGKIKLTIVEIKA